MQYESAFDNTTTDRNQRDQTSNSIEVPSIEEMENAVGFENNNR